MSLCCETSRQDQLALFSPGQIACQCLIIQSVNPPSKEKTEKVWVNLEQSWTRKWVMSFFLVCQHDTRLFWWLVPWVSHPSALHQMQSEYAIENMKCSESQLIRCPIRNHYTCEYFFSSFLSYRCYEFLIHKKVTALVRTIALHYPQNVSWLFQRWVKEMCLNTVKPSNIISRDLAEFLVSLKSDFLFIFLYCTFCVAFFSFFLSFFF